jgi:hypothetical protein
MSRPVDLNNVNPYTPVIEEDGTIHWGGARQLNVDVEDGRIYWTSIRSEVDFPDEKYVLDGIVFDFGQKTGTLGKININDGDVSKQIKDNIALIIENIYPTLNKLKYLEDIDKNDWRRIKDSYGVRLLGLIETDEIIGGETLDRTYEIILATRFINKGSTDDAQVSAKETLIERLELIRRKLERTKAGNFKNVRDVRNYVESEAEFIEDDSVVLIRAEFDVNFKVLG